MFKFYEGDLKKFALLLRRGVYLYEYIYKIKRDFIKI